MDLDIDELIDTPEPQDLTVCTLDELRRLRDGLHEVENGVSYIRRLVQGRIDTMAVELERRRGDDDADLISRLPEALARNTRGAGLPRPMPKLDPPEWADQWMAELDRTVPIVIDEQTPEADIVEGLGIYRAAEAELSAARRTLHTRIDRLQGELVRRYREGASVDDLLQT